MPFLPEMLRIPMKFEKVFATALESRDYKQLQDILENFSLNGGDGPGYFGYLFYSIYDINLIIEQHNILIKELNLYGREYFKRNHIKNIRLLRRSYIRLLSIQEQKFMKKYDITEEWLRIKILGRTPSMKIENYYYKILMEDIESKLKDGVQRNHINLIRESLVRAIKLGIELCLLLGWFLLYMVYSYSVLKRIMDKDDIIELFLESDFKKYAVKILYQLSEYYSINTGKILRFLPHRLHVISLNTYGSIEKNSSTVSWLGVIERCWIRVFMIYLYRTGLTNEEDLDVVCEVCLLSWEGVYDYISHSFEKVDISNIKKDDNVCYLNIKAYYKLETNKNVSNTTEEQEIENEQNNVSKSNI